MTQGGRDSQHQLLGGRYRILQELGRGGFGYTYLAEDTNRFHELCVLKEFFPQVNDATLLQKAKQLFEREAGVLYQLDHPQIPRFRELLRVQTRDRGRLFLVQDYVEGPTYQEILDTRLQSGSCFSEPEVIQLLQQLLPVLGYLHTIGVVHRDIAPDNLILRNRDGLPVLIDFGGVKRLATVVEQQVATAAGPTRLGKAGYAPEEQLGTGQVTPTADLYSLAVTALVLLTGAQPQALYEPHTQRWHWQSYVTLSPDFSRVLTRMLSVQPGDRYPSAAAVLTALSPFARAAAPLPSPPVRAEPSLMATPPPPQPTLAVAPAAPPPRSQPQSSTAPGSTLERPGPAPKQPAKNTNGCLQAIVGLGLLIGGIGLVWWIASRWQPTVSAPADTATAPDVQAPLPPAAEPSLSEAEQTRRRDLQRRRQALQVDERILVGIADQLFYAQFPDMQGRPLSDQPADEPMRTAWNQIANEVLTVLENNLSRTARERLGSYSAQDLDPWRQQINQKSVGSRSLNDLADAKFAYLYPQTATQNFIDQPIGQIWYGLADDRVRSIQAGDRLTEIQFDAGSFNRSLRDRLGPGEGRVYILNLSEGQLMRLNLQAVPDSTRISVYLPSPTEAQPALLEDSSDRTWSGQLPQSGFYEIVVVSTQTVPLDYALDIGADNVTQPPAEDAAGATE